MCDREPGKRDVISWKCSHMFNISHDDVMAIRIFLATLTTSGFALALRLGIRG